MKAMDLKINANYWRDHKFISIFWIQTFNLQSLMNMRAHVSPLLMKMIIFIFGMLIKPSKIEKQTCNKKDDLESLDLRWVRQSFTYNKNGE